MQAQRSVRVPGLFRASLPNIYTSQGLVPHLQRSARIREPLPGSGIDEDKAVFRYYTIYTPQTNPHTYCIHIVYTTLARRIH